MSGLVQQFCVSYDGGSLDYPLGVSRPEHLRVLLGIDTLALWDRRLDDRNGHDGLRC